MEIVEIEKEMAVKILYKLRELDDEGPSGEGWKSDELRGLIAEFETLISDF